MSKLLLPVATQGEVFRIPALIEEAGIGVEAKTVDDGTVYVCTKDSASATVMPMNHKQTVRDPRTGAHVQDFYPVYVVPKSGLFRWITHGGLDRKLQQDIADALVPIVLKPEA